jgi:hypothetical protein
LAARSKSFNFCTGALLGFCRMPWSRCHPVPVCIKFAKAAPAAFHGINEGLPLLA